MSRTYISGRARFETENIDRSMLASMKWKPRYGQLLEPQHLRHQLNSMELNPEAYKQQPDIAPYSARAVRQKQQSYLARAVRRVEPSHFTTSNQTHFAPRKNQACSPPPQDSRRQAPSVRHAHPDHFKTLHELDYKKLNPEAYKQQPDTAPYSARAVRRVDPSHFTTSNQTHFAPRGNQACSPPPQDSRRQAPSVRHVHPDHLTPQYVYA